MLNTVALRNLLQEVFDDERLVSFCYDHFRPVHDKFASGMLRSQKIQLLIEYCGRHEESDKLLDLVKKENPSQYDRFSPFLQMRSGKSEDLVNSRKSLVEVLLKPDLAGQSLVQVRLAAIRTLVGVLGIPRDQITLIAVRDKDTVLTLRIPIKSINKLIIDWLAIKDRDANTLVFSRVIRLRGSDLLSILEGLNLEPLTSDVLNLYNNAIYDLYRKPQAAIQSCQNALTVLEEKYQGTLPLSYVKGRCYLLLACIYLDEADRTNEETRWDSLRSADVYFQESRNMFIASQRSQLVSLVSLGTAITLRKLGKLKQASDACEQAQIYVDDHSIPTGIDSKDLRTAIREERQKIQESSLEDFDQKNLFKLKQLPIFKISWGDKLIATKRRNATSLNLLSHRDYQESISPRHPQLAIINLHKRPSAENADYILEIDEGVEVNQSLTRGDWLFIEDNPGRPRNGRKIVVMSREGDRIRASLRVFIREADHYFLKGENEEAIVLPRRKDKFAEIRSGYAIYQKKIIGKLGYDVQLSGPVIRTLVPREKIKEIVTAYIWPIPLISAISKREDTVVSEHTRYEILAKQEPMKGEYFGVEVNNAVLTKDDISVEDDISGGDIVIIHRQEIVENEEIALVTVLTPDQAPKVILRKFFLYKSDEKCLHWCLAPNDPEDKHIIVVPEKSDLKAIEDSYAEKIESGEFLGSITLYKNAQLEVIGQYIEVIKKSSETSTSS